MRDTTVEDAVAGANLEAKGAFPPWARVVGGCLVLLVLWLATWLCIVMSFFSATPAPMIAALCLFLASGPAARAVGRSPWFLAAPLLLLAVWGAGIAVAAAT